MFKRGGRITPSMRRALVILPIWVLCSAFMWSWWLFIANVHYMPLFILLTTAMLYEFAILPSIFLYFLTKAKSPARKIAPKGKKVAVITLCVPSKESIDIIENQLRAMTEIEYPHDSWVLDEGRSPEVKQLAKKHGVKYFSRKGVCKYNQPIPPFQKKTKAGNVNAWLEHVKRRRYDYFVQLDIDHIPHKNYLNKTLGYLKDPEVAWVQAPSVYKNFDHWIARGAAEQELVLQGPLQMGFYGHSETPFIIGSHCTYRMSAIRQIGGFQPTRAEDHLDTVHLSAAGYKGVFLPEVIAEGDGPETLSTYLAQQFAWAYSMFQVLIWHTPGLLKKMNFKRRWQFLFSQTWYPVWSLSYMILFLAPIFALWGGHDIVTIKQSDMLIHFMPVFITSFLVWWAARPLMRPKGLRLSWRGMILHAVRWPIILRAIIEALFKIKRPYMITPKGRFAQNAPSLKTYRPFLLIGMLSAITVVTAPLLHKESTPEAQMIFGISNAGFMLTICSIDLLIRMRQTKPTSYEFRKYWLQPATGTMTLALLLVFASSVALSSVKESRVYAERRPQSTHNIQPRPVSYEMSTQELIDQISIAPKVTPPDKNIGMYTANQQQNMETKTPHIQHVFTDWRDDHYIAFVIAQSLQAGNTPLVTIEPRGEPNGQKLLTDISSGKYDAMLGKTARILKASKSPIYVRFAHEMDLANLYPWGNQAPQQYIEAYVHARSILKRASPSNVYMVWSPAGNYGSEKYYPGDATVDIVGVTILYDEYWYKSYLPTFAEIAAVRDPLKSFGKPVWIVEFGAGKANRNNQLKFINDGLNNYEYLGYEALIYLNMKDANMDGPDYTLSDLNDFGALFKKEGKKEKEKEKEKKNDDKNVSPKKPVQDQKVLDHLLKHQIRTPF